MRNSCILFLLAGIIPLYGAIGFDEAYKQTESVNEEYYMTESAVTPIWRGNSGFYYTTYSSNKRRDYWVDIDSGIKREVTRQTIEDFQQSHRQSRGFAGAAMGGYMSMGGRGFENRSPDGRYTAFIRDNNVWIQKDGDENALQLSFDGTKNFAYSQLRWSPNSKYIIGLKKEIIEPRQILLRNSRPQEQVQPQYNWLDYAKPGDRVEQAFPALFSVADGVEIPIDTSPFQEQYDLFLGEWSASSQFFTFEYNKRGHQLYQLVAVDSQSGTTRVLAHEESNTFVYYQTLWRDYLDGGNTILWISERDGWRHLYRIKADDGNMTQLTKGEWNVREILKVNEEQEWILAYANGLKSAKGEDPYNKHLIRISITDGGVEDLTPSNGNHSVAFNQDYTYFVDNSSRPDMPYKSVVRRTSDGKQIMELHNGSLVELTQRGYTLPEVFKAKGRDGKTDIWGNIYRPANYDRNKKYPVIEYIYAGPHDSFVDKDFVVNPRFRRLVEMGFIVVTIDGMGTDNRSKSFQDVCWRNLKDAGFPDRILWIQAAAAKYQEMNINNVGIYGYSAGGQSALGALLFYPEFYKVAVSLCGCHDNRMDKIWWNEQWMGYPIGPWYSESSNVDNAWRLQGDLLLINGEMDDNVDPASTLQVVSELVKNNKEFQQFYLPGHTHNLGSEYITKLIYKFFWDHCRP